MATTKELEMLADEGISLIVNQETLEIIDVSLDGIGRISWVVPEGLFRGNHDPIWQNT